MTYDEHLAMDLAHVDFIEACRDLIDLYCFMAILIALADREANRKRSLR